MARYGLVVGVAKYKSPLGNLSKTESDAKAVNDLLKQHGDFDDIQVLTGEVTAKQLEDALGRLLLERADHNEALIYFSGHAVVVKGNFGKKRGYFALSNTGLKTSNGEITGIENGIALDDLSGLIGEAKLSNLVVLLDCCHSETVLEMSQGFLQRAIVSQAFAELKQDYFLVSACRKFEEAYAMKSESYSIFTGAMLRGLARERANERGVVDASSMFGYVAEQLRGTGQEAVSFGYGRALRIVKYEVATSLNIVVTTSYQAKKNRKFLALWLLLLTLFCGSGILVIRWISERNYNCDKPLAISEKSITIGVADFDDQSQSKLEDNIFAELRKNFFQYPYIRVCRIKAIASSQIDAKNLGNDKSSIFGDNGLLIWGNNTHIGIEILNKKYNPPKPLLIKAKTDLDYISQLISLSTNSQVIQFIDKQEENISILRNSLIYSSKQKLQLERNNPEELLEVYRRLAELYSEKCNSGNIKCQDALDIYQEISRLSPSSADTMSMMYIYIKVEQYERALQKINQLINTPKQDRDITLAVLASRAEIYLRKKQILSADKDLAELLKIDRIKGRIIRAYTNIDFSRQMTQVLEDLKYVEKEQLDAIDAFTVSELYFKLDKIPESQQVVEKVVCDSRIDYFFNNLRKSRHPHTVIENFIATLKAIKKDRCI